MAAHVGAVNCNGRRVRISEVLRSKDDGTITIESGSNHASSIGARLARYVIEHMHLTLLERTFVTSVLRLTESHAYKAKIVNTESLRRSVMRGSEKGTVVR